MLPRFELTHPEESLSPLIRVTNTFHELFLNIPHFLKDTLSLVENELFLNIPHFLKDTLSLVEKYNYIFYIIKLSVY